MRQLLRGIVDFRLRIRPKFIDTWRRLALGQKPDALFVACSDSRVVPNLFASTNPGDLFVVRNVGNLVARADMSGRTTGDLSEAAAIEYALQALKVRNIIVCGHSECGAMKAVFSKSYPGPGKTKKSHSPFDSPTPNLASWLEIANGSMDKYMLARKMRYSGAELDLKFAGGISLAHFDSHLPPHDILSQINVLQQLEHVYSYPLVRKAVEAKQLQLHGWYFDIGNADVYSFSPQKRRYVLIDEAKAQQILERLPPEDASRDATVTQNETPAWMDAAFAAAADKSTTNSR